MDKPLIMLAGLPGVGKTTVRNKLLEVLNEYDVHDNTQVRKDFGYKRFNPRKDYLILQEVNRRVINSINLRKGVILDSVHRHRKRRNDLYGLAEKHNKNMLIIECVCSEEEAKKRLRNRHKEIDGFVEDTSSTKVYDRHKDEWQEISMDLDGRNFLSYVTYDTESRNFNRLIVRENLLDFVKVIEKILCNRD